MRTPELHETAGKNLAALIKADWLARNGAIPRRTLPPLSAAMMQYLTRQAPRVVDPTSISAEALDELLKSDTGALRLKINLA